MFLLCIQCLITSITSEAVGSKVKEEALGTMENLFDDKEARSILYSPSILKVFTKVLQEESETSNMITTTTSLLSKVYKEEKFRSQIYSDTLLSALVRLAKSKVAADAVRQFANTTIVFWAQEENLKGNLLDGGAVDVIETLASKGMLI